MRGARCDADDPAQSFLNGGQSKIVAVRQTTGTIVAIDNPSPCILNLVNYMWFCGSSASHKPVGVCELQQRDFGCAQGRAVVALQGRSDSHVSCGLHE